MVARKELTLYLLTRNLNRKMQMQRLRLYRYRYMVYGMQAMMRGNYVQSVMPNGAGTTTVILGYMFWAAEWEGTRTVCTTPPNSCEGGIGAGVAVYNIPIPK